MSDRIAVICDLLLGAAYADNQFHEREKKLIRDVVSDLVEGDLPAAIEEQIEEFDPQSFDLEARAREFADDPEANHRALLELIGAVHEADDEFDLGEDDYMRAVADAIGADVSDLSGMTLDYEIEHLRDDLEKVRASPPPIPGGDTIDVDLDD